MKIIAVVGIRASGKTTVVENLVRVLAQRGHAVGTVKTIACPAFHMDKPGSNTERHILAGAAPVTARAQDETTVLYPRHLLPSEILEHYRNCDYVLWEGDYQIPVPRIVCARQSADALERINAHTLALSGRLADSLSELNGLPVVHVLQDPQRLADLLEALPETDADLEALDTPMNGHDAEVSGVFCAKACQGHPPKSSLTVMLDGRPLSLTEEQKAQILAWVTKS